MEDKKKNETRQSTMQNRMENMNGQKPKTISIVISVYNEEKALHEFYREATPVFEALPWNYELILSTTEVRTPRGRFWQNWRQRIRGYV